MLTLQEFKLIFKESLIGFTEKEIKDTYIQYLQKLNTYQN